MGKATSAAVAHEVQEMIAHVEIGSRAAAVYVTLLKIMLKITKM